MAARFLAFVFVGMILLPQPARAEWHNFYVCNQLKETDLYVGLVADYSRLWKRHWTSYGWEITTTMPNAIAHNIVAAPTSPNNFLISLSPSNQKLIYTRNSMCQ